MRGDLLDNIVAYWKMDETSGTRVDSISGFNFTDVNTVGYDTGKFGNAAKLIAANSEYLTTPDSSNLRMSSFNGWTMAFWAKVVGTLTPGTDYVLAEKLYPYAKGWQITIAELITPNVFGTHEVRLKLYYTGGLYLVVFAYGFLNSSWIHIAFRLAISPDRWNVSANGLHGVWINNPNPPAPNEYPFPVDTRPALTVGVDFSLAPDLYFDGLIDDMVIWQRDIGDQAVLDLANGLTYPFKVGPPNFAKVRGIR